MQYPTIHLNGSDPTTLAESYRTAHHALLAAMDALQATAPHGRDYYPAGPDAGRVATEEHVARLKALDDIIYGIARLEQYCQNAADARRNRG